MTAGELRDRVTWYPPVRTDNGHGQAVVTYPTADRTTWANVKPTTAGVEGDRHAQQTPLLTYEITLRSRTVDVRHDWQAAYRDKTLAVVSVSPHPNGGEWVLVVARERLPSTA